MKMLTTTSHRTRDNMADSPDPDFNGDTGDDTGGTPRWVKVFGIIALVVLLIFIIMLLTRGSHGPGRHMRGEGRQTPPVALIESGQQS